MIESYYIETREHLHFAVKGLEHPPDRVIAVLRYAPDAERGDRKKDGALYRRYYHFSEQEQFLQRFYPGYLAYLPEFHATVQSVPRPMVWRIYDPRLRLKQIMAAPALQSLEQDAADFTTLLRIHAGVPESALGITGSLLIGMQTERSDLDIVVFGAEHCKRVHHVLRTLLDTEAIAGLRRLEGQGLEELYAQRVADTHMEFRDFASAEKLKVNQGRFRERTYFIRFVKDAQEVRERYGELRYVPLGRAAITASVSDDTEAIFTPCRYSLSGVRRLEGPPVPGLKEIVSFRGRFCEQAKAGESIIAAGTLELVQPCHGGSWHRLLLGNSPEDNMVVDRSPM